MSWYLFIEGGHRLPLAPDTRLSVGRSEDSDVRITSSARVSRQHLVVQIDPDGKHWNVEDISANGSMTSEGQFKAASGDGDLVLLLGGQDGPLVALSNDKDFRLQDVQRPAWIKTPQDGRSIKTDSETFEMGVRLGRGSDNDVIVQSLLASPHHARVISTEGDFTILDLNSARGTFVNGQRVNQRMLQVGDIVTIGGQSFRFEEDAKFTEIHESDGVQMNVRGVTVKAGDQELLSEITFDVPPRSLLAIIGPSGSGKSTMLGALSGFRSPEHGQVLLQGRNLYDTYDDWRFRIGFVPQQDLVPAQLTVHQALTYAARLRFPDDTTELERQERINEVVNDLRLSPQRELRIDRLSGGQRKRVSVALELLTKPQVLFLDEPTSGLDPGLDQQLMMLLRELANDGRTVVVVTHAMDNLHLCDQVAVLAAPGSSPTTSETSGGRLAFIGKPNEALGYFAADDWAGVFLALEKESGTTWARRFASHEAYECPNAEGRHDSSVIAPPPRQGRALRQWSTLTSRTLRSTIADRSYASLLIALPIVLAVLGFLVGNEAGLGPVEGQGGTNPDARTLLLILILGATFTGAATTIAEFVKERVIYRRERAVGMSSFAYVTSKAAVLGTISAAQGFVFAILTLAGRPGAQNPLLSNLSHIDVAVVVALLAVTSAMLGLALSTLIPTREGTLPILVIVTMLQVVLSGAIPLRWEFIDSLFGVVMPAYWAFEGLAALADLSSLMGQLEDPEWGKSLGVVIQSVGALVVLGLVFLAVATILIRRSDPGKKH